MKPNGYFITLEGGEGAGKTTAARAIQNALEQEGYDVLYSREPGGSRIAEQIRQILLDPRNTDMDPRTEVLLYAASRAQHLRQIIEPALEQRKIVLCDRYVDSSLVYQGHARGLGMEEVLALNDYAIRHRLPDLTLYFSVDVRKGLERAGKRGELNRLDAESIDFHEKVREGYDLLLEKYPERIVKIDADQPEEDVAAQALRIIRERLNHDQR